MSESSPTVAQPDPAAQPDTGAPAVRRGKLRVFLGYAAGVGKTYQSLEEAHLLKAQGVDVVVGYFEPHGRKDTIAKSEGLEIVPRRVIEHRGARFEEMDTPAIVRRHPAVCLVDEFAHTNVPGVEHEKRWEDVMEILDAGIDVLTSLNVQHIESLNDQVWYFTGVRVRETVPDWVIKQADEVILVDVTPRALLHRLERGAVYAPDKAQRALEKFFTESNLTALRELAMRQTAHQIEDRLDEPVKEPLPVSAGAPAGSQERILLWLTPDPTSAMLVRRGHRVADYLHAQCIAVAIGRDDKFSDLAAAPRTALERHLTFARNLHIEVATVCGSDPAKTLAEFARHRGITQILVARNSPDISKLVHLVQDMQITIVAGRPTTS
jgi:two-component system sensor histidine kinase KdpD